MQPFKPIIYQYFRSSWIVLVLIACLLCGGGQLLWLRGLLMVFVGTLLIGTPPRRTPSRWFDVACMGMISAGLLSYLPIGEAPAGEWASMATAYWASWPHSLTIDPLVTWDDLLQLFVLFGWFYFLINRDFSHEEHKRLLWVFVIGVACLAFWSIEASTINNDYHASQSSIYNLASGSEISQVLCWAGIVAFGYMLYYLRIKIVLSMVALAAVGVIFLGLITSQSQVGVVTFFLGCAISLLLQIRAQRVYPLGLVGILTLILLGLAVYIYPNGVMKDQWGLAPGNDHWIIYNTASRMIADNPIAGVGLGNFLTAFPQYQTKELLSGVVFYPESDWVWWIAETGTIGAFFALLAVSILFYRLFPFAKDDWGRKRLLATATMVPLLISTIVAIPMHIAETALIAVFLYRMSWSGKGVSVSLIAPMIFRLLGLILVVFGGFWIHGALTHKQGHAEWPVESPEAYLLSKE